MAKRIKKALGIDIGGSGVKGAPVHLKRGELLTERFRIPTPDPATPTAVAQAVKEIAAHFEWTGPIGCTVPGLVRDGVVELAANLDSSWNGTAATKLLRKATKRKVAVINDADAAGLAEMKYGAGKDQKGVILVLTFGTGIGSALFLNRRLVPNTEFGHLQYEGILAEEHAAHSIREAEEMEWDTWARERVQDVLDHIEFLLSPDLIIVGGGVSRPDRWAEFGHLLRTRARLAPAKLGNNAGIVGAGIAARAQIPRKRKKKDSTNG
ncbi:MAG: ROK family protein [Rubricoccaceae bacterium]|nr:ROK family protein [Rubricoccaceae bacterium]